MTNKKLLEQRIDDLGLKKNFLAKKVGLSDQGFRNCLNNQAEFKASQIAVLCEILQITDIETVKSIFFAGNGAS